MALHDDELDIARGQVCHVLVAKFASLSAKFIDLSFHSSCVLLGERGSRSGGTRGNTSLTTGSCEGFLASNGSLESGDKSF